MTRGKGKHPSKENREVIESGIREGDSARRISAMVSASPSTVTREVRANRTVREPKGRDRVDRTGRTYSDFRALPIGDQANVCQGDSVVGFAHNSTDILSLMPVARKFQLYLPRGHADPSEVVACLDAIELAMGSREAFRAVFDPLLLDRGVEFDDWAGIERSALEPGGRRCRVYYCDPMESNQKSECERNHEQLRRILPKRRTDMDALSAEDVATCRGHVNSYPLESLAGRCPFDALGEVLPSEALALLGIRRVPPSEVVLKPSLMRHAVAQ